MTHPSELRAKSTARRYWSRRRSTFGWLTEPDTWLRAALIASLRERGAAEFTEFRTGPRAARSMPRPRMDQPKEA
jgi:hypothetical protein